jgi:hypothetical protein
MTLALLLLINMLWIPVGMFLLGHGEPKSTGFLSGVVGVLVASGAILQVAVFKDGLGAGFLFVFACLFLTLSYALLTGLEDLRTVGNASLVVAVACALYGVLYFFGGGVGPDAKALFPASNFFALCCVTWVILTLSIYGFTRGKISPKVVAWELIILAIPTLVVPAVSLMAFGKLPF